MKVVPLDFIPKGVRVNSKSSEKTETVVLSTLARQRVAERIDTIDTGSVHIKTSDCVKSLGASIDCTLSFNQHVNNVCKSAYYHVKALRHIRKLLFNANVD